MRVLVLDVLGNNIIFEIRKATFFILGSLLCLEATSSSFRASHFPTFVTRLGVLFQLYSGCSELFKPKSAN